jgi:hypothetical protein
VLIVSEINREYERTMTCVIREREGKREKEGSCSRGDIHSNRIIGIPDFESSNDEHPAMMNMLVERVANYVATIKTFTHILLRT